MQEILDSITEQKLALTTKITDLERDNNSLKNHISILSQEVKTVSDLSIENESLKRQLNRLTEENEELLSELQNTELQLKSNNDEKPVLDDSAAVKCEQIQVQLDKINQLYSEMEKANANYHIKYEQLSAEKLIVQSKCTTQEAKLKLYKSKLMDFSQQLKKLKSCKEILLTTVKEYSQAVSKWQGDILTVSNDFFEKNRNLKIDNKQLTEKLNNSIIAKEKLSATIDNLVSELNVSNEFQNKYNELLKDHKTIVQEQNNQMELLMEVDNLSKKQQNDIEKLKFLENLNKTLAEELEILKTSRTITAIEMKENCSETDTVIINESCVQCKKYELMIQSSEELKNNLEELHLKLDENNENDAVDMLEKTIHNLEERLETLKIASVSQTEDLKANIVEKENSLKCKTNQIEDLLDEMREINEALKNRGDLISKQEQKIIALEADIIARGSRFDELEQQYNTKSADNEQLISKLKDMEKIAAAAGKIFFKLMFVKPETGVLVPLCSVSSFLAMSTIYFL